MRAKLWVGLVCLAAAVALLVWYFLIRSDPLAEQVDRLLVAMPTRGSDAIINDLLTLGPGVIPHLARNAGRRESALGKLYRVGRSRVPRGVRDWLPRMQDPNPIRAAAMEAIAGLGPLAAYGTAREVTEGLSDPVHAVRWHAQYAVEWLAPEYAPALNAYTRVLKDTNQPVPLRDLTVSEYIWPRTPELVPVLIGRLTQPDQAAAAAIALRYCGSNAAPAIPALIRELDYGLTDHGHAMSAHALGALGVATPEVIAALTRAWNHTNSWVRENAANAMTALAPNITSVPGELISGLRDRNNRALVAKLEAFRAIGPVAREALNAIEEFTEIKAARPWVAAPDQERGPVPITDILLNARMAICRIAPDRCPSLLPELARHIGLSSWSLVEFLREHRGFSNEVIAAVEPLLTTNDLRRASIAAYIILGQNPNHAEAIAVLQRNKTQGTELERRIAAERLFDSTGDTNGVWELIEQGLAPDSKFGQWSIQWAGKMGPAAIPTLRRALWHKDKFVRQKAGMLLRKMAPEELKRGSKQN